MARAFIYEYTTTRSNHCSSQGGFHEQVENMWRRDAFVPVAHRHAMCADTHRSNRYAFFLGHKRLSVGEYCERKPFEQISQKRLFVCCSCCIPLCYVDHSYIELVPLGSLVHTGGPFPYRRRVIVTPGTPSSHASSFRIVSVTSSTRASSSIVAVISSAIFSMRKRRFPANVS